MLPRIGRNRALLCPYKDKIFGATHAAEANERQTRTQSLRPRNVPSTITPTYGNITRSQILILMIISRKADGEEEEEEEEEEKRARFSRSRLFCGPCHVTVAMRSTDGDDGKSKRIGSNWPAAASRGRARSATNGKPIWRSGVRNQAVAGADVWNARHEPFNAPVSSAGRVVWKHRQIANAGRRTLACLADIL